jgi:putative solute:sodium symporter small subunit
MSDKQDKATAYWKENLRYLLLSIWFAVSYGAGIIFKEALDSIKLGGFTWFFGLRNRVQFMYLSY